MANIDLEKIVGTDEFPTNENDVYALIETIASQRIMAVESANRLIDATFDYVVENGRVIQEAVIEMAKSYAYDKSAYDRAPMDPTLHVRYFSDFTERQFEVTIRRDDVRKIIANKGEGVEDVIAQILSTLTTGEGHEDFENVRALILNDYVPDYSTILGGVPKNVKGCIYAARNMYNHLKSDNSDLTEGAGTEDAYISATPAGDIRVAITESLLNLIDVVELANIFNLEKEELFGILVVVPDSDLDVADKYKIVVYDRKAMGRATAIYDFTQEEVAKGRYRNEYLTVSRAYFYNELFKAAQLDCTAAAVAAIGDLIDGENPNPTPSTPEIMLAAFEATDVVGVEGGVPFICNINKTKEEVSAILHELVKDQTASQGAKTLYLFGGESALPSLYVSALNDGQDNATYRMVYKTAAYISKEIWNTSYQNNGWLLTEIDMQTGELKVSGSSNAVGTLTGTGWNGVLVGKPVSE